MHHERRWRRAFRWSAAAALVCMTGFFLSPCEPMWVSAPRTARTNPPISWMLGLRRGMFQVSGNFVAERRGWRWRGQWDHTVLDYFPRRAPIVTIQRLKAVDARGGAWYFCVDLPLIYPALILGAAALFTGGRWAQLAHRRRRGWCWKCRYDRAGLTPATACPECGAIPLPASA